MEVSARNIEPADVSFRHEQRSGARMSLQLRAVAIAVIGLALCFRVSGVSLLFYISVLVVLLANGWLIERVIRSSTYRPFAYAGVICAGLIAADMCLITMALVVPAPGTSEVWTGPMQLRIGNVGFLFVFLVFSSVSYVPALALWSGFAAGLAWLGGAFWTLSQPDSFTRSASDFASMDVRELVATLLDPEYVSIIRAGQDALLLLIAGAVIATTVWRGRRHARKQVSDARDRAALARYFSPDVVTELTQRPAGLEQTRTPVAAVMFADIFGFTTLAEREPPENVLAFLREFHRRATGAVFAQDGTLNKFIGDEVMATFGAIHEVKTPAASALRCAIDIAQMMRDWSDARVADGDAPVRVGIGLHIGPVGVGNIGDETCLELAVLGDTVNVASRLQGRTRDLDAAIVVSRDLIEQAVREDPSLSGVSGLFADVAEGPLKGRQSGVPSAMLRSDFPIETEGGKSLTD